MGLEKAYRLSFAALQTAAQASPSEQHQVLQTRLLAMDSLDTGARLDLGIALLTQSRATLAAKAALQSLGL